MSESNKESKQCEANSETRNPLTKEDITIVTELANIGLRFIKQRMIPTLTEKKEEQQLKYANFLASVGDATVQKFDTICHYLLDSEKDAEKAEEKKEEIKSE